MPDTLQSLAARRRQLFGHSIEQLLRWVRIRGLVPLAGARPRRPRGPATFTLVCLTLLMCSTALSAQSDTSFYQLREASGLRSQQLGEHREAVRDLRIAAFGLLEEPALLARILVHLAESYQVLGDEDELLETLLRVIELEERFGAYTEAELVPDRRRGFEQILIDLQVPLTGTAMAEIFEQRERSEQQLLPPTPAETTTRTTTETSAESASGSAPDEGEIEVENPRSDPGLEATAEDDSEASVAEPSPDPDTLRSEFVRWLDAGKVRRARSAAEQWLAVDSAAEPARCYLATITRVSPATCLQLLPTLQSCQELQTDDSEEWGFAPEIAESRLACHAELGQLELALSFVDSLPEALTQRFSKQIRQIERRYQKQVQAEQAREAQRLAREERAQRQAAARAAREPQTEPDSSQLADTSPEGVANEDDSIPQVERNEGRATDAQSSDPTSTVPFDVTESPNEPSQLELENEPSPGTTGAGDSDTSTSAVDPDVTSVETAPAAAEPSDPLASLARRAEQVRTLEETEALLLEARRLADQLRTRDATLLAGRLAYRASRWATAIDYLTRGGDPTDPEDLFYLSVALWEVGYRQAAITALETSLPHLDRSEYVQVRARQILGRSPR